MKFKTIIILGFILTLLFSANLVEAQKGSRITRFEVLPTNIEIKGGHQVRFTAIAYTSKGTVYTPINIRWYATGGLMNQDGTYTAGSANGSYTITATCAGFRGTAMVQVKMPQPSISRVAVTPSRVNLQPGQTCRFQAVAYRYDNTPVHITPIWQTTGGGHIDNTGFFRAKYSGTFTVTAKDYNTNAYGTATVYIATMTPPPPVNNIVRLQIFPPSATVQPYQRANFDVKAFDRYGRIVSCSPYWSTNGGSITPNGWFTAPSTNGYYTITVTDRTSGIKAVASVKVGGGGYPPYPPSTGNARIQISQWDVGGGNFFAPKAKIKCKIYGRRVQTVKLYSVSSGGNMNVLQELSCKNGSDIYFNTKYDRFNTKWFEIRVYNNYDKVVAKERRVAK